MLSLKLTVPVKARTKWNDHNLSQNLEILCILLWPLSLSDLEVRKEKEKEKAIVVEIEENLLLFVFTFVVLFCDLK